MVFKGFRIFQIFCQQFYKEKRTIICDSNMMLENCMTFFKNQINGFIRISVCLKSIFMDIGGELIHKSNVIKQ